MSATMQGRRLPDNEWLCRAADGELRPGDYGRCNVTPGAGSDTSAVQWDWFVCCPDGSTTRLWVNEDDRKGQRHYITEHDDGTITVGGSVLGGEIISPTLVIGADRAVGFPWHGWLERGVWRPA